MRFLQISVSIEANESLVYFFPMNEQSRINSVIAYFFLGPVFLLAKSGTPLADPVVRSHAKKSTEIIVITLIAFLVYLFFLKAWINFSVVGIHSHTMMLTLIFGACLFFLTRGAYRAYHGEEGSSTGNDTDFRQFGTVSGEMIPSDDEKTRIFAALLPYFGIFLAEKYPTPHIIRARTIGSFFTFFLILSLYQGGSESFVPFLISGAYILFCVIEGVSLFIEGRFLHVGLLEKIPYLEQIEPHIFASLRSIGEFFRIVFGGASRTNYASLVAEERSRLSVVTPPSTPYFFPISTIGIPFWNLFSLPSLFIGKYREYRSVILQ